MHTQLRALARTRVPRRAAWQRAVLRGQARASTHLRSPVSPPAQPPDSWLRSGYRPASPFSGARRGSPVGLSDSCAARSTAPSGTPSCWFALCAAQRSAVRRAQAGSPAAEGVWACSCGVGGPSSTASAPACAGHLPHVLPLRSQRTSWSNSGSALAQRQTDRSGACRQARLPRNITPILCKYVCITQCTGGGLASHSVHRPVPLP
jgi:hypothetical protein